MDTVYQYKLAVLLIMNVIASAIYITNPGTLVINPLHTVDDHSVMALPK